MHKKEIGLMSEEEMASEIKEFITKKFTPNKQYIFISYSHKDRKQVMQKVLSWVREGYNLIMDLDFENHGSDHNWIDLMMDNISRNRCVQVVCFRSENYDYSYACLIELLLLRSKYLENERRAASKTKIPIDIVLLSEQHDLGKEDAFDAIYQAEYKKMKDSVGKRPFFENKKTERTALELGLDTLCKKMNEAQPDLQTYAEKEIECIEKEFNSTYGDFYEQIRYLIRRWFELNEMNSNYKRLDYDATAVFNENGVYRFDDIQPKQEVKKADTACLTEKPTQTQKRRGRPPKQAMEQWAQQIPPCPVNISHPLPCNATCSDVVTLGKIRMLFCDSDTVRRFREVRESMPRGGKGAMDFLMAALLGGCNQVSKASPAYQINYYLYAVSAGEQKGDSLGATWTWSSNCRKVLGLEKSGAIPAELNRAFAELPENTTLQEITAKFRTADAPAFQTKKNKLVLVASEYLERFLNSVTVRM